MLSVWQERAIPSGSAPTWTKHLEPQPAILAGSITRSVDPATASSMAIDASGKLGTMVSSRRFKHDIKPMDKASEAILALKPVTFHYKSDAKNTPCFGLIAEEVAGGESRPRGPQQERRNSGASATIRSTRCCSTSSSKNTAECVNEQTRRSGNWKQPGRHSRKNYRSSLDRSLERAGCANPKGERAGCR